MLKSPRRLPRRFNRRVTSYTDRLVRTRRDRHRKYARERWFRLFQRAQRKALSWRAYLRWFVILLAAGAASLVIGMAFFSSIFTLKEIRVRRSDQRIEEELVQVAMRPLLGKHLLFFSSADVLPLLTAKLHRLDRSAVPDLREAEIRKDFPSSIVVQLTLDPLIARLSIEEPGAKPQGAKTASATGAAVPADFLTDEGMYAPYLPSQVQSGSGAAALPQIRIVDWSVRPQPWSVLLDPQLLLRMREAERQLKEQFGATVRDRVVYLRAREFHLKIDAHELWFDRKSPLEDHLARYRLFLDTVGAGQAKRYVDLRLRDRVVYR